MEKKALGKGLEALLPERSPATSGSGSDIQDIPIVEIQPNRYQPRKDFAESDLAKLAESIKKNGLLQPVLVRPTGQHVYELIAGERRLRASKVAGISRIPAIVRTSNNEESMELSVVENIQRRDLNPMEEARAYARLMSEFGLTQDVIAQRVGKDRSSIANIARLVTLPQPIQRWVESGQLTLGHAKVIMGIRQPAVQLKLAQQVVQDQLSVRQAEQRVTHQARKVRVKTHERGERQYRDVEERLQKRLGTRVAIKKSRRGGQMVIHYFSDEDLDRILEVILA